MENKEVEGTVVYDTVQQQKSEKQNMEEFVEKYKALCEQYGFNIVVNPAFVSRDDGTFSLVLQSSIGKLAKGGK